MKISCCHDVRVRTGHINLFLLLMAILSVGFPRRGYALSCSPADVKQSFSAATAVFTGEIVDLSDDGKFTFRLLRIFKGDVRETAEVYVNVWERDGYKKGDHALVFAELEKKFFWNRLAVLPCGRIHKAESAKDILLELEGLTFVPGVALPDGLERPRRGSSQEEKISFYLSRLKDKSYVWTTEHDGASRVWFTADEELGLMGRLAVPHLIRKLDTTDQYELAHTLYALMLASQAPDVREHTNGEYVKLVGIVFDFKDNSANKDVALHWWKKHKHLWN